MAQERTHPATPRRREEARRRGQVVKSTEVNTALVLLLSFVALRLLGSLIFETLGQNLRYYLSNAVTADITPSTFGALLLPGLRALAIAGLPIVLVALVAGTVANLLQTGLVVSAHPVRPDLQRINPLAGFKRLISIRALFDLVKSLLKLCLLLLIFWVSVNDSLDQIILLAFADSHTSWLFVAGLSFEIALKAIAILVVLALGDYLWQRYQYLRELRMSPRDVRDEMKETEGDPLLRRRIRERGRALATRRMMREVPRADVVVTNPTEIAVALKYDSVIMSAPRVVAKGERLIAQRIRALAEEHDVPIVQNPPLAQVLNRTAKIGDEIPSALYQAVAEVLAFVYRVKGANVGR